MGSAIGRIEKEFILNSVMDAKISLRIHGFKMQGQGLMKSIEELFLTLTNAPDEEAEEEQERDAEVSPFGETFPPDTEIRVYFSYYGHVMTFSSTVRAISGHDIKIDFPDQIYKNLARKYERVPAPVGVSVSFEVEHKKVTLDFPKTEEYDAVDEAQHSEDFDPKNLGVLIDSLKERTKEYATICAVTMFRDRGPDTVEEKMISQSGKILFIPDVSGSLVDGNFPLGEKLLTRAMLMQPDWIYGEEGTNRDLYPGLIADRKAKGIQAELLCPVIYHDYAVGYVRIARDREMEKIFDSELLQLVYQFTKILSYSLKINGYFGTDSLVKNMYEGDIIDISASGMFFANPSPQVRSVLALYSDIELVLKFGPRAMKIGARVMRTYRDTSMSYYGLQFIDIKPEDFRFIFDFVYGRGITTDDERFWEGGSEPPGLKFD